MKKYSSFMMLSLAFVGMFSIPSAFAEVEMVGVDIFCEEGSLFGFVGIIQFLDICPVTGISPTDADGDGLLDSEEDANGNGIFEPLLGETDPNDPDTDGDALFDGWEVRGLNGDKSIPPVGGTPDLDLPALGANPLRSDIFVEVDYMEFHQPPNSAINDVITAFSNGPVNNPDGSSGVTLHVDIDEQIPHEDEWMFIGSGPTAQWPEFESSKIHFFGTTTQRLDPDIIQAKNFTYHYGVFIHEQSGSTSSGRAEIFGNDFVVSLGFGKIFGVSNPVPFHVQDHNYISGTFMHELGHNLKLEHGGDTGDDNCKPNYLSVMSYSRQTPYPIKFASLGIVNEDTLDYSQSNLTALDETSLDEQQGIEASTPSGKRTLVGSGIFPKVVLTGHPVDWNNNFIDTDTGVVFDINNISSLCPQSSLSTLTGYDDWDNLFFNFIDSDNFADGVHIEPETLEITLEALEFFKNGVNNLNATKDSFLTQGNAKQNEGINPTLQMKSSDKYRPVISFNQTKIEIAASGETLDSATLRLYIVDNNDNWGSAGNNIFVHRILDDWDEGNGWNTENTISGNGTGVTWNCPVDSDISNNQNDCAVLWGGGSFAPTPTDSILITNGMANQFIEFDVTSDVQSFIDGTATNFGWIIKKGDGSLNGSLSFTSKESQNNIPQLILNFD